MRACWDGRPTEGVLSLAILFSVAVVLGVVRAFNGPALSALAPNLVPKAILPNAIALSSIAWQTGMIVGPAVGGYTYAIMPALPYAVAAALFVVSIVMLSLIGPVPQPAMRRGDKPLAMIVDGMRYVGRNRMVLGAITLDLLAVFLAGATALFPVYARDVLQVGAPGLAQLAMAPAIGAALTALWFSVFPLKTQVGPKMLWSVAVFGVATIVFGLSTSMPLSLAALFVVGAGDMFSVYIRQSLIQLHTPDDKRGRVSSVSHADHQRLQRRRRCVFRHARQLDRAGACRGGGRYRRHRDGWPVVAPVPRPAHHADL